MLMFVYLLSTKYTDVNVCLFIIDKGHCCYCLFTYYRLSILLLMFIYLFSTKYTVVNVYLFVYLLSTKYSVVNMYLFIID